MKYDEDLNTPLIAVAGVVFVVLIFAVIVGVQALFYSIRDDELDRKQVAPAPEEVANLEIEQKKQLSSYEWVDSANGVVGIPIERAMEITAAELEAEKEENGEAE